MPMWGVSLSFYVENLIIYLVTIPGRKGEGKVHPRAVRGSPQED